MTYYGKFDTDASALSKRIHAHEEFGSNDLNKWIFSNIELTQGLSILDLGCGTGKQTIQMAEEIGDDGHVTAVDISNKALLILSTRVKDLGLEKRVNHICIGLDEIDKYFREVEFNRVLSSYSLYYAQDAQKVIRDVKNILKPSGIFFFCGPTKNNNYELKQFHYDLKHEQVPSETGAALFMEKMGQHFTHEIFGNLEFFNFENPLNFNSPEALYNYWSSYNLYEPELDSVFKKAADVHFQHNKSFKTVKRVIGVKAING